MKTVGVGWWIVGMVTLESWSEQDFGLLERCNTPEMTAHLGGPETPEKVRDRHRKYAENAFTGQMFVIVTEDGERAGLIGYWEHADDPEHAETVWETGWAVLPEFQGRGLAALAVQAVAEVARAAGSYRTLHAYPGVTNAASNALCRKAGFSLVRERDFEYPKGHWMRCNDWSLDL
ncbi:GNAT family N-acetyltransferase [Kribbella solani]|uniref:GNAT family N-acetyltransferase n=1 Tax=Kribbella solani TaxID=236067 RepID=UPI0029BF986A|nr:GNAT family N-acetyltransferase [Kribbella solani]MDX2972907.1 GNAT family N-acetyltransferase [Kribbella solani]